MLCWEREPSMVDDLLAAVVAFLVMLSVIALVMADSA
jgi:hypothetical protein